MPLRLFFLGPMGKKRRDSARKPFTMKTTKNPFRSLCPVLDSNQHVLTNTTPSRWRVYQFHQLGKNFKIKSCSKHGTQCQIQ